MRFTTCLFSMGVLFLSCQSASASMVLQIVTLAPQGIGFKLSGTLSGPTPDFNQNILSIHGLNIDTESPIEWIIQQRTLTQVQGTANGLVNGVSLTFAGTENLPATGLGDHVVMVFDQPLVADTTIGLGNNVTFSTTGVIAINPVVFENFQNDLVLYWGSNGPGVGPTGTFQSINTLPDPPLVGDLNNDGFVGIDDLNTVLGNWNQNVTPGDPLQGDPTGDGFVGIEDLNQVLSNWNAGTPPPGTANADVSDGQVVPEPNMLAMLLCGLTIYGLKPSQRP